MGFWRRFIKWLAAAFVIGGVSTHAAYTASKTRVQDKMNPNKRTRSKKPTRTEFKLEFDKSDPYGTLNKPGSCITRLFPNIEEEKTFFTKDSPGKESEKLTITETEGLEDNDANNPPEFGCYMYYHHKTNSETRFEIAIRGKTDGWVWMGILGSYPQKTELYKTWYREFLLEKIEKIWEVKVGQEGEIDPQLNQGGYKFTIGRDRFHNAFKDVKWIHMPEKKHCQNQKQKCDGRQHKIFKAGYWTPDKDSKNSLVQITEDMGNQITRWSDPKNHKLIRQGRKRIYKDYQWYDNVNHLKDQPLIKLENKRAALVKGNWKDFLEMCENKEKQWYKDMPYRVLCEF